MAIEIVQVDAFTDRPFTGNPAAVCLLDADAADDAVWMQQVAREMNLSETAFVVRSAVAGVFGLRWFTPTVEVDLCGHATLAAAHVLWTEAGVDRGATLAFDTRSGRLGAAWRDGWIELDFPSAPAVPAAAPAALLAALGVAPRWVGRSRFDFLVEVDDEAAVRAVTPDLAALRRVDTRGVIVTSRATTPGYDFVSRFFAPGAGVDEDPVTGSAHCCLAPFWHARVGRDTLVGYQASARGGVVRARVAGDRVALSGQAVTVLRATLTTP